MNAYIYYIVYEYVLYLIHKHKEDSIDLTTRFRGASGPATPGSPRPTPPGSVRSSATCRPGSPRAAEHSAGAPGGEIVYI